MRYFLAGALIFIIPAALFAHPLDLGFINLEVSGNEISVSLEVNSSIDTTGILTDLAIKPNSNALNFNCENSVPDSKIIPRDLPINNTRQLNWTITCPNPIQDLNLSFSFLEKQIPSFQLFVKIGHLGNLYLDTLKPDRFNERFELKNSVNWINFIISGIEHIGASPKMWRDDSGNLKFPEGIDHILFLVGLILTCATLSALAYSITGFTVGHCITLVLGALGLIEYQPQIFESLIQLSIIWVGIEAIRNQTESRTRLPMATFFGLVHGLGFSQVIREMKIDDLSMFLTAVASFNIGIEFGQIIILILVTPLILKAKQLSNQKLVNRAMGVAISLTGAYLLTLRLLH